MDIERIKAIPRYSDFVYLNEPVEFYRCCEDKDYDVVQIHDINPISNKHPEPIGFCGTFEWKSNILTPLDGDDYTSQMLVYAWHEFTSEDGLKCIDILTDKW